jgi:transposase
MVASGVSAAAYAADCRSRREPVKRHGMTARIARKGIESATHLGRHRYVIARCPQWISRCRRLARRYDRKASHYLGLLHLARALIRCRRAARLNLLTSNNS